MIVKCEQCQTRFKIADDKVTEKGVKVRCAKCSHTFRVSRSPEASVGVAETGDPFAKFGALAGQSTPDATRPGVFALGVEATKNPAFGATADGDASAAKTQFDFGSLAPPLDSTLSAAVTLTDANRPSTGLGFLARPAGSVEVKGTAERGRFDSGPRSLLDDVPPLEERSSAQSSRGAPSSIEEEGPSSSLPEQSRRSSTPASLMVNIGVAVALATGLMVVFFASVDEGNLLSAEGVRNALTPSVDFVTSDVSNGVYETRAGRSVFFVRGYVTNRTSASARMVVKAELVEAGNVVRSSESWAGFPPNPEEIFSIENVESLQALQRKVEMRSGPFPPEVSAPFVILFNEYPPDLKTFRVRVSARSGEGSGDSTAAVP